MTRVSSDILSLSVGMVLDLSSHLPAESGKLWESEEVQKYSLNFDCSKGKGHSSCATVLLFCIIFMFCIF